MKLSTVIEAKHVSHVEWFKCPDCDGQGGFYTRNGPDDYDVEMCDMCRGSRRVSREDVDYLTSKSFYTKKEFIPIREAKHIGINKRTIRGELFFDDRYKDDFFRAENVSITFKVIDSTNDTFEDVIILNAEAADQEGARLIQKIGLKGSRGMYQNDNYGEMVSGWMGKNPWSVEVK